MKKVFRFNIYGKRCKPTDFNTKKSWAEISPHTSWDSRGMLNGLIQDLAIAVMHKFKCYNISGKRKANKVSESELYLLLARAGVKVCSMTFLQDSLQEFALNQSELPALGHVVTALTKHFRIPVVIVNIEPTWSLEGTPMRCINEHELKQSAQEYTKRKAYKAYFKKLTESSTTNTDQAGSSRQSSDKDKHEKMNGNRMDYTPNAPSTILLDGSNEYEKPV
ncbi:thyroxine-binding globulin [Striga asiatica]|uniref:Thyroxine-binding globulin n=1 Tax=Striga asiatica TaxID=4170 RepID=A0A5A7PKI0_STRAF|nr:thyroxine-binding globulin [Striga asiatica]